MSDKATTGSYEEGGSPEALKRKAVICIPTMTRPYQQTLDAVRDSVPLLEEAGWDHGIVFEVGCPYISAARATMLRKAIDAKATHVVFIDHDVSWEPKDLLALLETEGNVVAGMYRYKKDEEQYMGNIVSDALGRPSVRPSDGAIKAAAIPAGFLRVTRACINKFMETFPELCYGERCRPHVDLFNHGAHKGTWWGEDFAFARRWTEECGGEVWVVPGLSLTHWAGDKPYHGNLHKFLLRQPGGSESDNPVSPADIRARLAKAAA